MAIKPDPKHSPRFLALCEEARKNVSELSVTAVKERLAKSEPVVLIDVREDHEWNAGCLPKAQHLGRGIIERDIEALYPDFKTEMILYCGGGFRSALAAVNLQKMGYTNVWSMDGGFRGWSNAGLEIVPAVLQKT